MNEIKYLSKNDKGFSVDDITKESLKYITEYMVVLKGKQYVLVVGKVNSSKLYSMKICSMNSSPIYLKHIDMKEPIEEFRKIIKIGLLKLGFKEKQKFKILPDILKYPFENDLDISQIEDLKNNNFEILYKEEKDVGTLSIKLLSSGIIYDYFKLNLKDNSISGNGKISKTKAKEYNAFYLNKTYKNEYILSSKGIIESLSENDVSNNKIMKLIIQVFENNSKNIAKEFGDEFIYPEA